MSRRLSSAPSPSQDLQQQLDALLLDSGDNSSILGASSAGVGGFTIVQTPSPSVAVSALSATGSIGAQRSSTINTPRFNIHRAQPSVSTHVGGQLSASRGGLRPPNSAAQALMRSSGSPGGGLSVAQTEYGVKRAGYVGKGKKVMVSTVFNNATVNKRDRRCFGLVGEKGVSLKFCLCTLGNNGVSCGAVESHEKKKFQWPYPSCGMAYAVPASSKHSRPNSFVAPMISDDETLPLYREKFENEKHTSAQWTEIIVEANQACWQQHLYTQAMEEERDIQEGEENNSSATESDDEESSGYYIPQTSGFDKWTGTSNISVPAELELELIQTVPADEEYTGTLLEHREALETNAKNFKALVEQVPRLVDMGIDHIKPVVSDLLTNTNAAVLNIAKLAEAVGNVKDLRGHESVTDGVLAALDIADTIGDTQAVWSELTRLGDLLGALDDDVNVRVLDAVSKVLAKFDPKLMAIIERLGKVELRLPPNLANANPSHHVSTNPVPSHQVSGIPSLGLGSTSNPPSSLHMSSTILKDDGTPSQFTLGSIIATLEKQALLIEKLQADLTAQGGVTLDIFSYPSEASLGALIRKEGVRNGKSCFAAIVDPVSIFVHDVESVQASLGAGWSDIAKSMRASGINTDVDRYFIHSCSRRNVKAYHDGTEAPKAGSLLSTLATMATWNGVDGRDGSAQTIMTALDSAQTKLAQHIQDYTPANSELQRLANYCAAKARDFHSKFHDHVRSEMIKLVQMGVPEKASLELLSEQFILMFNRFFEQRKLILQHREGMDMVDFTTRVVWVTLKTQVCAAEFVADGIKNHSLPSNAFLRFLTSQTGANVSTKLGPRIGTLEDLVGKEVKKLDTAIKKHTVQLDKHAQWQSGVLAKNDLKKP